MSLPGVPRTCRQVRGTPVGIAFEIYDDDFKQLAQPARYREIQHPLGLTGLARLSAAVESVEAAATRLHELAEFPRSAWFQGPGASARGVQMQVRTAVWELLEPTGDGPLADYLGRCGQRIRSTAFKAGNLTAVEQHLTAQGFDLIPGDADGVLAIKRPRTRTCYWSSPSRSRPRSRGTADMLGTQCGSAWAGRVPAHIQAALRETVRHRLSVLTSRLQHATIVPRNFKWDMTDGFKDAIRAKVSR